MAVSAVDYVSNFFYFWHTILSCLPSSVLTFFFAILQAFIIFIFVKLLLSWL